VVYVGFSRFSFGSPVYTTSVFKGALRFFNINFAYLSRKKKQRKNMAKEELKVWIPTNIRKIQKTTYPTSSGISLVSCSSTVPKTFKVANTRFLLTVFRSNLKMTIHS
jgi:hypothetical protein